MFIEHYSEKFNFTFFRLQEYIMQVTHKTLKNQLIISMMNTATLEEKENSLV
jgi:hypothetical protein